MVRELNEELYDKPTKASAAELRSALEKTHMAVFTQYLTDGRCFGGEVLVILYPGDPGHVETYCLVDGDCMELATESYIADWVEVHRKWKADA